jgi:ubiquinone/menaquinone biosynthesis C-methylase UbiE
MGLYSKFVFPHLLDWGMGKPDLDRYRKDALAAASGETLEIGFGTGVNLPHDPASVKNLAAVDSEEMLPRRVQRRIEAAQFPVQLHYLDAQQRLPFADSSFDTIVTTFVLCSIEEPASALAEINRLLKPDGQYLFFEHGSGLDPRVQCWQRRFNPINRLIGGGCNLNRTIDRLITNGSLEITSLVRFLLPGAPRLLGELYRGTARRA